MAMQALRDGAASGFLKIILMGLLMLAVGGLVLTDVGGFFRGGVGNNDVAKAGTVKIGIVEFDRTLRGRLSGANISSQQAYQFGLVNQLLDAQIDDMLLLQTARQSGLKIGRADIAQNIKSIIEPNSAPGESAQDTLERMLRSRGLTEQMLVRNIEQQSLTTILSSALQSSLTIPSNTIIQDVYKFRNESRDVELILFKDDAFTDFSAPSEDDLRAAYETRKQRFIIPETRDLHIIALNSESIKAAITIEEDAIRAEYEDNILSYTTPETRSLAQAIFKSEEDARAAFDKASNGSSLKAASDGNTYIPPQALTKNEITPALRDGALNASVNDIIGPVQSTLGWHIAKLTKIVPETVTPYNNVSKDIKDQLLVDETANQLSFIADELDDLLASGTPTEDIANELDVSSLTLSNIGPDGRDKVGGTPLSIYGEDAAGLLASAFELFEDEATSVIETRDGQFLAVYINKINEESYQPFEEVKADLETSLNNERRISGNGAAVDKFVASLKTQDDADLKAFAAENGQSLQNLNNIIRSNQPPEPLNAQSVQTLFSLDIGQISSVAVAGGTALVRVVKTHLPDEQTILADTEQLDTIESSLQQNLQQEAISAFMTRQRERLGVRVNQGALRRAYGTPAP